MLMLILLSDCSSVTGTIITAARADVVGSISSATADCGNQSGYWDSLFKTLSPSYHSPITTALAEECRITRSLDLSITRVSCDAWNIIYTQENSVAFDWREREREREDSPVQATVHVVRRSRGTVHRLSNLSTSISDIPHGQRMGRYGDLICCACLPAR